jgi:hypothetical protein
MKMKKPKKAKKAKRKVKNPVLCKSGPTLKFKNGLNVDIFWTR